MRASALPSLLLSLLLVGLALAASARWQTSASTVEARPSASPTPRANRLGGSAVTATRGAAFRSAARAPVRPTPTAPYFQSLSPTRTPRPTQTARPAVTIPARAEIKGIYGYGQLLALSCESRSAADWARHFGVTIHELEFFHKLPRSSNPEEGFVGDPNGGWGNLPPGPYGVHAKPVATLLKSYGLQARAERNMRFDDLQREIAAGRPVIVWVTGHVAPGKGQAMEVAEGKTVTVARYEHTVLVIGYDEKRVTILDGKTVYQRPVETFLQSWSPLENMAVVWDPHAPLPPCDAAGGCGPGIR